MLHDKKEKTTSVSNRGEELDLGNQNCMYKCTRIWLFMSLEKLKPEGPSPSCPAGWSGPPWEGISSESRSTKPLQRRAPRPLPVPNQAWLRLYGFTGSKHPSAINSSPPISSERLSPRPSVRCVRIHSDTDPPHTIWPVKLKITDRNPERRSFQQDSFMNVVNSFAWPQS